MESTINVKLDFSGLEPIKKACKILDESKIHSGVLDEDPQVQQKAFLNEYGGWSVYDSGPFMGERVLVPPRSFVRAAAEIEAPEAFAKAKKILSNGFTQGNAKVAIETVAIAISDAQKDALDNNGSKIPGWIQHNEPRTVATKGFDRPLWSRRDKTFPIDYEVVK